MTLSAFHKFEAFSHPDNFGKVIGYQVGGYDLEKNEVSVQLNIEEVHLSPTGEVHGGVISSLLDFASGGAVLTSMQPDEVCSTVELKVNYFSRVQLLDKLTAQAKLVFRGKSLRCVNTFLYRESEVEPVAMGTATFRVGKRKS